MRAGKADKLGVFRIVELCRELFAQNVAVGDDHAGVRSVFPPFGSEEPAVEAVAGSEGSGEQIKLVVDPSCEAGVAKAYAGEIQPVDVEFLSDAQGGLLVAFEIEDLVDAGFRRGHLEPLGGSGAKRRKGSEVGFETKGHGGGSFYFFVAGPKGDFYFTKRGG